ncbi:uncharacterized protein LOC114267917 isoform X2 [Camellia sinensis]|uniref:uncharacterized protein LOC114267917 isoform X2 n=1 Tax=Camellia sinensis TaxID=4442 RepID=UPI001035C9DE|nr:uncharacterized protein LOC114267917 isoform X2 [Camellia sinensis]
MEMTNDDDDDEVASHFQRWRLFCLAFGFVLLLLAPVVSSWVPFYYSGSMAVGVFLVIIILLFQTAAEIGLGDEIITNSEEKCFLPHSIWIGGAALGYWMVQKFVISDDGSVDVGAAQFEKWAMHIIAATFIFQSTLDTPLAMGASASCLSICFLVTSFKWNGQILPLLLGIQFILQMGILGGVEDEQM